MQVKSCSKCKQIKPFECFGKDKRASNGLKSQCKECEKEYRKNYKEDPIKKKLRAKKYSETHRDIERARAKRWRENNPDKVKEMRARYYAKNRNARREEYDRHLARLGKTRRPILTDEEKEAKRLEAKEKARVKAQERYLRNFKSEEKTCRHCGNSFMTQYKKSKVFCSETCTVKHSHYMSKLAEKRRKGKILNLERMDNDITLPLLYKRDKGVCKICGLKCDWSDIENKPNYSIVGNMYPSIDHIKPISRGGSHTWDNVQLTHKYCNTLKNDKEAI